MRLWIVFFAFFGTLAITARIAGVAQSCGASVSLQFAIAFGIPVVAAIWAWRSSK